MTPERLARIRSIYEAALDKTPAERDSFIEQACEGELDIRREVEALLAARERVPEWLSASFLGPTVPLTEHVPEHPVQIAGRQLGGYRLIREIGRGGMGFVYLAERSDGAFHKQVAVKLVRPNIDSAEILDRFRREREILASLDHPNIARLIDGGTTEDGLPYFVMELVEGQPIHRWCDERKLNVTQRLELFRTVCSAVQYAHQHLVVHRDLKPSNILVTADGTVKLLDFGIAKLVGQEQLGMPPETRTLLRMMTPDYASPEQFTGAAITTLTDVYSLGVVLYELLTGHRPYRLTSAAVHEIARVIAEEEPTRPSLVVATTEESAGGAAVTPEVVSVVREGDVNRLRRRLAGDLDCVVLTTLRKEPQRRYSSAEALADDIRRHLENRPVSAREDSWLYRTTRFIRRHPGGVLSGVLGAFSVGAGLLTTLWQMRVAIESASRKLPAREILAPQMTLFVCLALTFFIAAIYLTRASSRRVVGALAGGALFGLVWIARFRIDYAMGWWRSRFPETADPLTVISLPIVIGIMAIGWGAVLLCAWRLTRRFGWKWNAAFLAGLGVAGSIRDRIWWDRLMHVMEAAPGITAVIADAALLAGGTALGYALMRVIAGPAGQDRLARAR